MTSTHSITEPIGIGIIGLGHVSSAHLAALEHHSRLFTLVAVCDSDWRRFPPSFGGSRYTAAHALAADPAVDAVLVAVPLAQHAQITRICLSAMKHVLLEKPATETESEMRSLFALAEDVGVQLHVAFHAAFASDLLWFLEHRQSVVERLGALRSFACEFFDPYIGSPDEEYAIASLRGSWADSGINALSVACRIAPDLRLHHVYRTRIGSHDADDVQASSHFIFPVEGTVGGQGHGRIDTNWTLGFNQKRTWLYFDDPAVVLLLDHSNQRVIEYSASGAMHTTFEGASIGPRLEVHYTGVFGDFANHLRNSTSNASFATACHRLFFSAWKPDRNTSAEFGDGT